MQRQYCDVLRVFLIRNYPKTASERPQSGPVTPSASNEEVHGPRSMYSGCPYRVQTGWNRVSIYVPRT